MQILELQIKNFGKFADKTILFHRGINILYGSNETGKSTIHSFIRAMFFGLERQRGKAAKSDEYSLREPWENPGYFAGVMRFECGGKIFRLERNFQRREKSATLVCETDGEKLSIEDGDLSVLLEGLNEAAFCNTFFIGQKGSGTDAALAQELRNYMSNMENARDSEIDVTQAISALEGKKKQIENAKKKRRAENAAREGEYQMKLSYVQQELSGCIQRRQECMAQRAEMEQKWKVTDQEIKKAETKRNREVEREENTRGKGIPGIIIAAIALIICVISSATAVKLFSGGVSLCALAITFLLNKNRDIQEKSWEEELSGADEKQTFRDISNRKAEDVQLQQMFQNLERMKQEMEKLNWQLEQLQSEVREKQTLLENLQETLQEFAEEEDTSLSDIEIEALNLAVVTLQTTSAEIYSQWSKQLNRRISEILTEITDGRYTSVFLDENLQIRINTPTKLIGIWQVSRGTMDQIYFALRMAAGELLSNGEMVPIILDEAFAMYDEERLRQTLRWLEKSKKQVLLFTCHRREGEILEELRRFATVS